MLSDLGRNVIILIPALNPTMEFIEYVNLLIKNGFKNIVIINDGSDDKYESIFNEIDEHDECHIIKHEINEGKGKSIKDGLEYFKKLEGINEFSGVITVDCDGQHLIKDIIAISKKMNKDKKALFLGTRDFSRDDIPPKSSFGNKVTSNIFKILYGVKISDTQTGLRGISKSIIDNFISLSGNRYEYETNMLIECIKKKIEIVEIPIETVYIDNNSNTHFRPIHDSILIYWRILNSFFKYSIVSIISCIIDIIIFQIFLMILKIDVDRETLIIISTFLARIISSLVNYGLNKKVTFESNKRVSNTIVKYYVLCITQMIISGILVSGIYSIVKGYEVIIKLIVDTVLFFVNFKVQKKFIFCK